VSLDADPHPASPLVTGPGARLLKLQELDLSIGRLRGRIALLESQEDIRAARDAAGEVEGRLGALQLSIDEVAREQTRLETDLDSMQQKIDAERKREFDGSVVNAKELQSIEAEIANLNHRRSDKEDRLLELMEQREDLDARLKTLEGEVTEARSRLAEIEQSSGRELVELRHALAERTAEREALVPEIDPELLEVYEDLRRQKRGVGAASLVDGVCQGCHQKLSPMYIDRLKHSTGPWRCEYCRRILVPA
jgi:predicted  nucleic acid-binding Zn-ribbon protein